MRTFRVYFVDGNQKLLEGENMIQILSYLVYGEGLSALEIVRIEEVQ